MSVDYNAFAKDFAQSRKNMKWEEIEYFFSLLWNKQNFLDIWCGSGRLLEQYEKYFWELPFGYMGIDLSAWLLAEARKNFPGQEFEKKNMLDIDVSLQENIFLIASFHHLQTFWERQKMMHILFESLQTWWKIFMTNWALESPYNKIKYQNSVISGSENEFGGKDFSIKFWDSPRFYHSFSLHELESLASQAWFQILENRLFDTEKNFITILQK